MSRSPLQGQAGAIARRALTLGGIAIALAGCASSSISADARGVADLLRDRAAAPALAVLAEAESGRAVEPTKPPDRPLTEDDAVKLALANNREVWAALYEIGIARGRAEQAGLLPNPSIELGLRAPDNAQPLQADVGLELALSEMILVPQKRGVAEAELSAERIRVAGEVLDMAYLARVAFYKAQAEKQKLELKTRLLQSFQAGNTAAEELAKAGNLPEIDVATRRAAVEAARISAAESELSVLEAREAVNAALGLSGDATGWTAVDLPESPDNQSFNTAAIEKRAIENSLDLAQLAGLAEAAARRAGLARASGILPHLEGGLHGEHDGFSWEIGAHLTVGLPVFDRGQGREGAARAEVMSLRERYVATAVSLRAAARTAMNRVESAAARARHYRTALIPARKKALAETILQYNAMQVSVFRVLEAEREVTDASLGYVDTLLEYHVSRAGIDQIVAGRFRQLTGKMTSSSTMMKRDSGGGDGH